MALNEGRCTNCGSILFLDPKAEQGHCLFCDAVFDNKDAFDAARDPDAYEFPNVPQPKYEGPNLDPRPMATVQFPKTVPETRKKESSQPAYVPKPAVDVPKVQIPRRTVLAIIIGTLVIIGAFLAITLPLTAHRDAQRQQIFERFAAVSKLDVKLGETLDIRNQSNNSVVLVVKEPKTQAEATALFKQYSEARAEVLQLADRSFAKVYGPVTMRLATPDGGFLFDKLKQEADLEGNSKVLKLQ